MVHRSGEGEALRLRAWLAEHADSSPGMWVVLPRARSAVTGLTYDDVIEEALCFGWIDSTYRRRDDSTNELLLAPRRPHSTWARTNKDRVERLTVAGLMTEAGQRVIDLAKANGSWHALDAVERREVPEDLARALDAVPEARAFFDDLPPSARQMHLWFVISAKRPDTRARRVAAVVDAASEGRRAVG